ncbi:MAG: membrane protein insertase YidC, partial [Bacteroidales bacterium]
NTLTGDTQFITLENELLVMKVSTRGGSPYSVELKNYKTHDEKPLILFSGDSTILSLDFFAQNRSINTRNLFFTPLHDESYVLADDKPRTLTMRLAVSKDRYIDYNYTIYPDQYKIDFDIVFVGLDDILARNTQLIDLKWEMYMPQQEKGRENEDNYSSIYYKFYQGDVDNFRLRSNKNEESEELTTDVRWIAYKDQFFSSVLIADESFVNAIVQTEKIPEPSPYFRKFSSQIAIPYQSQPNESMGMAFYFGPNHYNTLRKFDIELESLVELGGWIIKWINRFVIIPIFNFLNNYISNYGIIILLLTIIIKMALLPLTYKSYISMAKMRVLKPQIDEINAKIPKEKAMERQQATMALYKKAGVNPMGGCLPMLLQMPILFAMFRFFPTSIELRQESFLWAHDLSTYDSIVEWSGNIPLITEYFGNHLSLFTLLMTISTILTMKLNNQTTASTTQMPGMKTMMYMMPVMFMFILNKFSAALTYYYFLANLITFGQNMLFKRFVDDKKIMKKISENKKKPVKKSKFQERLEQAAKQKGYKPPRK